MYHACQWEERMFTVLWDIKGEDIILHQLTQELSSSKHSCHTAYMNMYVIAYNMYMYMYMYVLSDLLS